MLSISFLKQMHTSIYEASLLLQLLLVLCACIYCKTQKFSGRKWKKPTYLITYLIVMYLL